MEIAIGDQKAYVKLAAAQSWGAFKEFSLEKNWSKENYSHDFTT